MNSQFSTGIRMIMLMLAGIRNRCSGLTNCNVSMKWFFSAPETNFKTRAHSYTEIFCLSGPSALDKIRYCFRKKNEYILCHLRLIADT